MKSKSTYQRTIQSATTLILGLSILMTTGCLGGLGLNDATLPTEPPTAEPSDMYQVEMLGGFSRMTGFRGEIDGPIVVQDALERSGATKKFRSMDILIVRTVEETGRQLRLEVGYVPREKSVKQEENYAILPNDRILVRAKSTNAIDQIVDSLKSYK